MPDTVVTGVQAGLVGGLAMTTLEYIGKYLGLIHITNLQIAASTIIQPDQANTVSGIAVGLAIHLMIAIVGGVLIALALEFSGKDFFWVKGITVAASLYLIGMGVMLRLLPVVPGGSIDNTEALMHIASHGVYGVLTSFIAAYYGDFCSKQV